MFCSDRSGQLLNIFGDGVVVDTVENEVVLQRPHAVYIESAGASGAGGAALVGVTLPLNAGDQVHQIVPTAQQQRILGYELVVDGGAQRRVFRGQQLRGGLDGGDGRYGADGQREILAALLGGVERHVGDGFLEPGFLDRDLVSTDRKIGEEVVTGGVALNYALDVGSGVARRYFGVDDHCIGCVLDKPGQAGGVDLGV